MSSDWSLFACYSPINAADEKYFRVTENIFKEVSPFSVIGDDTSVESGCVVVLDIVPCHHVVHELVPLSQYPLLSGLIISYLTF